MSREIGIILVHGIGSQVLGQRAREMMVRLCDKEACCKPDVPTTARSRYGISDQASAGEALTYRFNVHGEPVQLREAHWAHLSHPDNPPRVQLAPHILREFIDTVSSAWLASPIAWAARRLARRRTPAAALLLLGTLTSTVFAMLSVMSWVMHSQKTIDISTTPIGYVLSFVLMGFALYFPYRNMRHRWLVLRHTTRVRRIAGCVIYSPIAYVWGMIQFLGLLLVPMLVAEILLFMAVPVIVAVILNFVAFPISQLFVQLGRLAAACRMEGIGRWVHRSGWVMVVLPVNTLLQATKASGNLMSILFCEKQMKVKATAVCLLVGVYLSFFLVMLFIEILIIPPFDPLFLGLFNDWADVAIVFVPFFGLYLLLLRLLLTPIDLLLDIGNYHVASIKDRSHYHRRVDQAVRSLLDSGCTEIHIVAHSLGSVIVYDWLSATASTDLPLVALHTLGSPLNKFWYLDHPRRRRFSDANLPDKFPACRWTNYWAFSDVISGPSTRYRAPGVKSCDKRIRWLGPALASHVYYWRNSIVVSGIRNGIGTSEGSDPATSAGTARI